MGNCPEGGGGSYEPRFQDTPPGRGGGGLFCQAITGADGPHRTDMGTKNQNKMKMTFWESAPRGGGVRKAVICPPFDEKDCKNFLPNMTEEPLFQPPPPSGGSWGLIPPLPALGQHSTRPGLVLGHPQIMAECWQLIFHRRPATCVGSRHPLQSPPQKSLSSPFRSHFTFTSECHRHFSQGSSAATSRLVPVGGGGGR